MRVRILMHDGKFVDATALTKGIVYTNYPNGVYASNVTVTMLAKQYEALLFHVTMIERASQTLSPEEINALLAAPALNFMLGRDLTEVRSTITKIVETISKCYFSLYSLNELSEITIDAPDQEKK
jgi:hypothetical protein